MELRDMRIATGMSQREVGDELGVGQSTVAMWETGDNRPRPELLPEIARLYRVPLEKAYLLIYGNREGRKQHD